MLPVFSQLVLDEVLRFDQSRVLIWKGSRPLTIIRGLIPMVLKTSKNQFRYITGTKIHWFFKVFGITRTKHSLIYIFSKIQNWLICGYDFFYKNSEPVVLYKSKLLHKTCFDYLTNLACIYIYIYKYNFPLKLLSFPHTRNILPCSSWLDIAHSW
jgi:hypothetical protein